MNGNESWDNLKMNVLALSGIESIEPKDCKKLSILIAKETKKNVSETTLKRIYGFAVANFEPSLYTRNLLAQYCGHTSWEGYMLFVSENEPYYSPKSEAWDNINKETNKVNFFMLRAVKNKAVIPFDEMIDREFIYRHFRDFDQSERMATVIAGPTGYGKTIAVCKWLTEKLAIRDGNDIVLYFNSSFLLSSLKTAINLNYWMMKMVGLAPSHDFEQLILHHQNGRGNFYFVIDGFDELMFRKNQFEVLSHLLLDILSIYKFSRWFKIVVIMRDSTWLNWKRQLMSDPSYWYLGEMNDQGQNVGLLTAGEVNELLQMDRPFTQDEVNAEDFAKLRFPLFHHYFYKKYNSIIQYEEFNELLVFELATDYMNQNIIHGNQGSNKIDFIFYLLKLMKYESGVYLIDKSKIHHHQRGFTNAYSSLIQMGFLLEKETTYGLNKYVYVHFVHLHFLGCCVAALILKNDAKFSLVKLEYIQRLWSADSKLKINILKWCVFLSVSAGQQGDWINGYRENLDLNDLQTLAGFIAYLH